MMRQHHARDYAAMKTALRALVDRVGGVEAASSVLGGYPTSRISEAMSLHHPERMLRVDLVADLEAVAGQPLVSAVVARLNGCVLLPMPAATGDAGLAVGAVLRGAGEVGARAAEAMADGTLTDAERGALADRLGELARAVAHAQAVLAGPKLPLSRVA